MRAMALVFLLTVLIRIVVYAIPVLRNTAYLQDLSMILVMASFFALMMSAVKTIITGRAPGKEKRE